MHPILSDFAIRGVDAEIQANLVARQRLSLAREASQREPLVGAVSRLATVAANTIRQFVDPRGYALTVLETRDAPEAPLGPWVAVAAASPAAIVRTLASRRPATCGRGAQPAALADEPATAA